MSNYTQLGFVKQTDGENIGTWGDVLNESLIDLLDDAIGGYVEVSVASGNVTLAFADGTADNNGRHAVIKFTGSPGTTRTVTLPNKQKTYYINNGSDGSVICTAGSGGATVTIPTSKKTIIYVDGSDEVHDMFSSPSLSDSSVTNAMLAGSIADSKLSTISTAGKVDIGALEIDGATDIGADLADADLIIVDDGAGGTERKAAMSRVATYVQGGISGDVTISSGTAAIGSGVIVNADINNSAAIAMSKTAFSAGTGVSLSTNTLSVDAAQTGITSILATDLKIGEDDQTKIDFETADEIHFYAANAEQVFVSNGVFGPQTDSDVDLGTNSVRFKDAYVDSVTVTGDVSVGDDLTVEGGVVDVKNTGAQSQVRFYCESSNAHYAAIQAPAHSAFSGNTTLTLPAATDTIVGRATTDTLTNKSIDSDNNTITNIVNADIKSSAAIADSKLATISTAGKVALTALEIDGGSDIGADLTTSDLIIVDDGAGGTNRKAALSRVITLVNANIEDPTALAIALG